MFALINRLLVSFHAFRPRFLRVCEGFASENDGHYL